MSMIMHVSCALTLGFSAVCANFEPKLFDIVDEFPKSEHLTKSYTRWPVGSGASRQQRCAASDAASRAISA
jgi:hypothetical protein